MKKTLLAVGLVMFFAGQAFAEKKSAQWNGLMLIESVKKEKKPRLGLMVLSSQGEDKELKIVIVQASKVQPYPSAIVYDIPAAFSKNFERVVIRSDAVVAIILKVEKCLIGLEAEKTSDTKITVGKKEKITGHLYAPNFKKPLFSGGDCASLESPQSPPAQP